MATRLETFTETQFRSKLEDLLHECPVEIDLEPGTIGRLWFHYTKLVEWNRRVSLVGPGAGSEILERHYLDSLMALPLIESSDRTVVDIGTGGGFPGLVLAAARSRLAVTMIEPRQKKWAFLATVSKGLGLSSPAVNARVERPLAASIKLPESIDIVTSRALVISPEIFGVMAEHSPRARFLLWRGRDEFRAPEGYRPGRTLAWPSGDHRRIIEIVPAR